jgi:peptidyl-prolyl isomerase D
VCPRLVWTPTSFAHAEAIRYAEIHHGGTDDAALTKEYDVLLGALLLNGALAAIKAGSPKEARSLTTRALGLPLDDKERAKALYRRALAAGDDADAERDLADAAALQPEDAAIRAELARVRERAKAKKDAEKKRFKKMFG